jgi:hypothetical protein
MELISSLTFTEVKRLTGLDDVKVSKGRENFEQMRQLAKIYCPAGMYLPMVKRIDDHELFCQTDLTLHFKSVGGHCCSCLTCGFLSESKLRKSKDFILLINSAIVDHIIWLALHACSYSDVSHQSDRANYVCHY